MADGIPGFSFAHVGVAVPDVAKALPVYENVFGYRLLSGPFDDPIQRVTVCFLGNGDADDVEVELVAPLGDDSPVKRLLARGGGAYHVAYYVDDIARWTAEARAKGCVLLGEPVPAVAYGGRKIAWLYLPSRQLVEVIERD
jgi:methylmalonyl-CoA/ethylmalonyl-CoA epimerase